MNWLLIMANAAQTDTFWGKIWHWVSAIFRHPINTIGVAALICWGIFLVCLFIDYHPVSNAERLRRIELAAQGTPVPKLAKSEYAKLLKWSIRLSVLWLFMTVVYYAGYLNGIDHQKTQPAEPAAAETVQTTAPPTVSPATSVAPE